MVVIKFEMKKLNIFTAISVLFTVIPNYIRFFFFNFKNKKKLDIFLSIKGGFLQQGPRPIHVIVFPVKG